MSISCSSCSLVTVTFNLSQPPTPRSISTPLLIATAMATTLDPETLALCTNKPPKILKRTSNHYGMREKKEKWVPRNRLQNHKHHCCLGTSEVDKDNNFTTFPDLGWF